MRILTGCVGPIPLPYSAMFNVSTYTANKTHGNVGESRNFTCPLETVPSGESSITCLANGEWETPRCQGLTIVFSSGNLR